MIRITQWEFKSHPAHGYMCLEGVVKGCKCGAPPDACAPMVDKTIRTSRITGHGACDKGITVKTLSGQTYLLVGMSRPDLIRLGNQGIKAA